VAAATCPIRITLVCGRLDPEVEYTVDNDVVIIELRSVPDCPNLDPVREALSMTLADLGLSATVIERVGDYPSPSVLINGADVMGTAAADAAACLLDLPTGKHLRAALQEAMAAEQATNPTGAHR
jgi:hypothetical protein